MVSYELSLSCVKITLLPVMLPLGIRGTYQGLTATVLKQGTNQMIRFFVFTTMKSWVQGDDPNKDIGSIWTFCIGGIAGAASVFGNTPIDVVKTRMQVYEAVLCVPFADGFISLSLT
jgi:hypothetical protein